MWSQMTQIFTVSELFTSWSTNNVMFLKAFMRDLKFEKCPCCNVGLSNHNEIDATCKICMWHANLSLELCPPANKQLTINAHWACDSVPSGRKLLKYYVDYRLKSGINMWLASVGALKGPDIEAQTLMRYRLIWMRVLWHIICTY